VAALAAFVSMQSHAETPTPEDPYLWLENIESPRALQWVEERNAVTRREIEPRPDFAPARERLLSILQSKDRIPTVMKRGAYFYNFWQDADHIRGVWRRTTPEEFRQAAPKWETVLDLDALATSENENWVMNGIACLYPDGERCLIRLSRGGGDTIVVRELDVPSKSFVKDGFIVPPAKTRISWRDKDSVYVGTDFGPDSLTDSGYPRVLKLWKRGTPLTAAPTVFEGKKTDVSTTAFVADEPGFHREMLIRALDFYTAETHVWSGSRFVLLDAPKDADVGTFRDQLLLRLRTDWKTPKRTFVAGSLIAMPWDKFLTGGRDFKVLFTPTARVALNDYMTTRDHVVLNVLDNVHTRISALTMQANGEWKSQDIPVPDATTATVLPYDDSQTNNYLLLAEGYLTPSSLYRGEVGTSDREKLKQLPSLFNADGFEVTQRETHSKDGTRVPYYMVARKNVKLDGTNPTLLNGYGGFEVSELPHYAPRMGASWLERGGVYVVANIRGGGEFGPDWHMSSVKEHRQRVYDDFIAVAEDLIARKITAPAHLGIMGGSNGGLLMGVMLTQRPELFGAIVCQVPLLDMHRYHKLLAGASWMAEYGDPDNAAEWEYIGKYSPYQKVLASAHYPRVLFTTSTRDDRVHPGHARKMAARMLEQGHDILLYENTEGGHAGAANSKQRSYMEALEYTFLWKELK
jgi:prolyl oligopeptidase